ncbi:MAG TPA: AAA family ATPase [Gaiellaceae bacterium]|nr:AAA family ATPase [Gaiellaceae bacterium]
MLAGGRLLLERDAELARLRGALAAARAGSGAAALLTGPAGIGKTRLARALRDEAREDGVRVLSARGAELEHDFAFGVVRQWFEPLVRGSGVALEGAAALAAPVLLGEAEAGDEPSFSILHGLYWLAAELAGDGPLALFLDDAQWSDEASLRFVHFLAGRLDGLPLLLLLTAREPLGGLLAELARSPAADVLVLPPLGPGAVTQLLHERSGGRVDEAFALACRDATGGNPFLLEELAQALAAEGVEFVASERGRVRAIGPRSVATAVQLRLAALPAEATRLARAAAVAGDDAPLPLVAALAELSEAEAAAAADELASASLLEDARPLRFVHPIVAAAIRESLLAGEREGLHARAAGLLEAVGAPAEAIAVHLLAVAPAGEARVAATLLEAAERSLQQGAPEAAASLLERALAEPPGELLPRVLLALGNAEHRLERPGAAERLREAHRLAPDPRLRAEAALVLTWAVVSQQHRRDDLQPLLERSIAEVGDGDRELLLRLEAAWLGVAWDRGDLDAILERGERFADLAGESASECLVLAILAHAWMDAGRPALEVAALAERAARREVATELARHSLWLIHLHAVLATTEQTELLSGLSDAVVADAQQRGALRSYLLGSMTRASLHFRAGDVRSAEADATAALTAESREAVSVPAVGALVSALVEQDRLDEAAAVLAEHGLDGELPAFRHGTVALLARARLHEARGDLEAALADYAEMRRRLDRAGRERVNVVGLDGRVATAVLLRALGRTEEADREAVAALEAARRWGTPGAIGTALHALGVVRDDVGLLREATALLAESPFRLREAKALLDLGSLLRRSGRRSESREPLRRALALADGGGAARVRELAREELAASGVRVRRAALSGAASLTPSERRIAERAAAGASNPEIAQALFVTVKTVEMHLSNAYRKLEISGRGELARALAQG